MAEGGEHTAGAELAAAYVSARVKFADGEKDIADHFKAVGEQADAAGGVAGVKIHAGIVEGIQAAGKTAPAEAAKVGEATGKALTQSVVGAVSKDSDKIGDGILAGLDNSKASQAGAKFGQFLGQAISAPITGVMSVLQNLTAAHGENINSLKGKYTDLGGTIASARVELERMRDVRATGGGVSGDVEAQARQVASLVAQQAVIRNSINKAKAELTATGEGGVVGALKGGAETAEKTAGAMEGLSIAGGEAAAEVGGVGAALAGLLSDPVVLVTGAVVGLAAGLAESLSYLYDLGDKWEEVFSAIEIQTGATGDALNGLKGDVEAIAPSLALPIEQIGKDVGAVKQQFGDLNDVDLQQVTTTVGQLQHMIGDFDLRSVGQSFRAFDVTGAKDQTTALNELFHAYQETGIGVDELARNVAAAQPTASQFNLDWGQTAGILTSFESAGLDSSKALLALSAAQKSMEKGVAANPKKGILGIDPVKDPADLNKGLTSVLENIQKLESAGDKAGAKDLAEQVFGKSTGRGGGPADNIIAVLQKGLDPSNFTASLNKVNSSIDETYEKTKTVSDGFQDMKNAIDVALEPVGSAIHEVIAGDLEGLAGWVATHKKDIVNFFVDVGVAAVNMGAFVTDAFGQLLQGLGAALGPIATTISAFGSLADAVGAHGIADDLNNTAAGFKSASDNLESWGGKVRDFAGTEAPKLIGALEGARDAADGAGTKLGTAAGQSISLSNALKGLPPNTKVNIDGSGIDQAADSATKLKGVLDGINGQITSLKGATGRNSLDGATLLPGSPLDVLINPDLNNKPAQTDPTHNSGIPTLHKAYGGTIDGIGPKGKDSVPILAAPGEHMWTADEVDKVGGQSAMYHLRAMASAGMLKGFDKGGALFDHEGPDEYMKALAHNRAFAVPSTNGWQTTLNPDQEKSFQQWVKQNNVPFDTSSSFSDYDMRGFWASGGGSSWTQGSHFPDTYKTPFDTTFSNESKYATKDNPFVWKGDNLVDSRTGAIVFGGSYAGGGGIGAGIDGTSWNPNKNSDISKYGPPVMPTFMDPSTGNFNPGMKIDTSTTSVAPAWDGNRLSSGDIPHILDPANNSWFADKRHTVYHKKLWPAPGSGTVDGTKSGDLGALGLPGFAKGGAITGDESGVSGFSGMKYGMGLFGNGGFDCSGAVSAGVNVLSGRAWNQGPANGSARMDTADEGQWLAAQGWKTGVGPSGYAMVGWTTKGAGGGHTAMTFPDGTNFESSSDHGVTLGGGARGALDPLFDKHAWLPLGPEAPGGGGGAGGTGGGGSSSGGAASSAQLSAAGNAVSQATNAQTAAQQKVDADKADPKTSKEQMAKDQDALAKSTKDLTDKQQKLVDLQNKKGTGGNSQLQSAFSALGGAGGDFLKDNLPPGFSDPTSWPLVKTAGNLLKDIGGVVQDPTAKALLGAGGAAIGGDFGGAASGLAGLLPQPFGALDIGSPGQAPGIGMNPVDPGSGDGSFIDPSALIPNLPKTGQLQPGHDSAVTQHNDFSSHLHGDVGSTDAAKHVINAHESRQARVTRTYSHRTLTKGG